MTKIENNKYVLGVKNSAKGYKWLYRNNGNYTELDKEKELYDIPDLLAKILIGRGVNYTNIMSFLSPSLKKDLPNPSTLKDMDKAASIIVEKIINKNKITILGDYDVDGATSAAILFKYLRLVSREPNIYIPDRIKEGYGPNKGAVNKIINDGSKLLITVDCGISSHDVIDFAVKNKLDVIIVDHHQVDSDLPNANAIINPKRSDDSSNSDILAAVGVSFLLVVAINRLLRSQNFFNEHLPEPNLVELLDIVALGTICDLVPMIGINRLLVQSGIRVMNKKRNIGITALLDTLGIDNLIEPYHLGYYLGPCINAGGRVGESSLGVKLLTTPNKEEANKIANKLKDYNEKRKQIEKDVFEKACLAFKELKSKFINNKILVVESDEWHPGVIGIVASRLVEKYKKPSMVISLSNSICKGSARSLGSFDIGIFIKHLVEQDIFISGGGHAMAGGFSMSKDNIDKLKEYINTDQDKSILDIKYKDELLIDAITAVSGANTCLLDLLKKAGPYGPGNVEPRFILPYVKPLKVNLVGSNHISVIVKDETGSIRGIAFRASDTKIADILFKQDLVHIAGRFKINEWNGKKNVQVHIEDVSLAK